MGCSNYDGRSRAYTSERKVEIETIPYPEISVEWMQKELAEIKVEAEFSLKEENMQALFDVSTQGLEAAMKELAKIIWAND